MKCAFHNNGHVKAFPVQIAEKALSVKNGDRAMQTEVAFTRELSLPQVLWEVPKKNSLQRAFCGNKRAGKPQWHGKEGQGMIAEGHFAPQHPRHDLLISDDQ